MSISKTDFKCPYCTTIHTEEDYYKHGLSWRNHKLILMKCKNCHNKMSITINANGYITAEVPNNQTK